MIIIINLVESESVHCTTYSVPHMYDVGIGTNGDLQSTPY